MLRIFGCLKNYVDHIGKSREKRLELNHCEKVGAVNALVRASIVLTDAPHMLNLERDNHINNCKALKEIVLYNGLEKDRWPTVRPVSAAMDEQRNGTFDTYGVLDKLQFLQVERFAMYHDSNSDIWEIEYSGVFNLSHLKLELPIPLPSKTTTGNYNN
ncbi:hypothetical protein VitviT2T_011820 [Vitis vinifera]|uniref:Uncharacterized protein n=1 Tax=Vitis vinifera TaxID=29760 RepID=A0ABY9CDD5_VITVI|nr:hypothetical protein VitviT2T_011820 [Vitis vinifera]